MAGYSPATPYTDPTAAVGATSTTTDPNAPANGFPGSTTNTTGGDTTLGVTQAEANMPLPLTVQGPLPAPLPPSPAPQETQLPPGFRPNPFSMTASSPGDGTVNSGLGIGGAEQGATSANDTADAKALPSMTTVGQALTQFWTFSPDEINQIGQALYDSGFFPASRYGTSKTPYTPQDVYAAYKAAVLQAANTKQSLDQVEQQGQQRSQALGITGPNAPGSTTSTGPSIKYTAPLTNVLTINDTADKIAQSLLGRKATPDEKASIAETLRSTELTGKTAEAGAAYTQQLANLGMNPSSTTTVDSIIKTAMSLKGTPYVYGGKSPQTGLDCSGFVQAVFAANGITIGGDTSAQRADPSGTDVSGLQNAQPGDLLFFGDTAGAHAHVGIYLGNGQMISAENPQAGIQVADISSGAFGDEKLNQIKRFPVAPPVSGGTGGSDTVKFAAAIASQESGGDYNVVNKQSGAFGKYQFLPSTYATYAKAIGVDPADHSPAAQDKVALSAFGQLYNTYGSWDKVAAAWYGGAGGEATYTAGGQGAAATQAGNYPSINSYVQSVMGKFGPAGPNQAQTLANQAPGPTVVPYEDAPTADVVATQYDQTADKPEYQAHQLVDAYTTFQNIMQSKAYDQSAKQPMEKV